MSDMRKVSSCKGEGQGSCKRCSDNGIQNRSWMCFLYQIEGMDGCYCDKCVKEILKDETETWHSYHGSVTVPKGTMEKIYKDCEVDT